MCRFLQKVRWFAGVALMLRLLADVHEPAAWASPRRMTEFHHRMWTSDHGIGAVFDIQQTSNGYLWLTTSTGVFRFDGVRFQSVEQVTNGAVQNHEIQSAFLSASGGVWLKTRANGLLFLPLGQSKFQRLRYAAGTTSAAFVLAGSRHYAFLHEAPDGTIWLSDD